MRDEGDRPARGSSESLSHELLQRARDGDGRALDRLFAKYLPSLRRWARGRIPAWARGASDTSDFVQDTLLGALRNLDRFEPRERGALLHYLRRGIINRVRDHVRNSARHPNGGEVDERFADAALSQLDLTIEKLQREQYLAALTRMRATDRVAIVCRLELGYTYDDLKVMLGSPTTQAARQLVRRALFRLADEMRRA